MMSEQVPHGPAADFIRELTPGDVVRSYDPRTFQALAIARGIRVYLETGMLVNRSYKPGAMLGTAERILGRKFAGNKLRLNLQLAADALKAWADERSNLNG